MDALDMFHNKNKDIFKPYLYELINKEMIDSSEHRVSQACEKKKKQNTKVELYHKDKK